MGYIGSGPTRFNTADELTVTGDAQIDGTTLVVDSTNNQVGIGTSSPAKKLHLTSTQPTTVSATNIMLEGGITGYGAGVAFGSRTSSGGTLVEMAKITADGEASFNTTASTQDAGLRFFTAEDGSLSERVRIASGGSVGIGTTSPSTSHRLTLDSSSNYGGIQLKQSGTQIGQLIQEGGTGNVYLDADSAGTGGGLILRTNGGSERMRINSNGTVLVGISSETATPTYGAVYINGDRSVGSTNDYPQIFVSHNSSNNHGIVIKELGSSGNAIRFLNSSGTVIGSVTTSASGTTYNTASDLRLKTDIQPIDHATDMLMAMNPVSHKWKADPDADAVVGFIAQEMQEIVPEAVSGDADSDDMMSMDYGRITPVLVAALQDAHKKIEQLEQRIADMENN